MTHQEFIDRYLKHSAWHITDDVLYIEDDLSFFQRNIKTLPDNLFIRKNLMLMSSELEVVPKNLTVIEGIDFENSNITSLVGCLKYGSYMDLSRTKVRELPPELEIMGPIDIRSDIHNSRLKMTEHQQIEMIKKDSWNIEVIKDPTEKAKTLHKLLWEL